MHTIFVIDFTV